MKDQYLEWMSSSGNYAYNTIRRHKTTLRALWLYADNPMTITKDEMWSFVNENHLSPASKFLRHDALKGFYGWLKKRGEIFINPMDLVDAPKVPKRLPSRIMNHKEAQKLLEACPIEEGNFLSFRDRMILELLYSCSMRRSEIVTLDVGDFDRHDRTMKIRQLKTRRERLSPVGYSVAKKLEEYIDYVRPKAECPALFLGMSLKRMGPDYITHLVADYRKIAKIKTKASSHSFRKTSATLMLKNGAPIRTVQKLLGHRSLKSTMVYTEITQMQLEKMLKANHPREKKKNIRLPELKLD